MESSPVQLESFCRSQRHWQWRCQLHCRRFRNPSAECAGEVTSRIASSAAAADGTGDGLASGAGAATYITKSAGEVTSSIAGSAAAADGTAADGAGKGAAIARIWAWRPLASSPTGSSAPPQRPAALTPALSTAPPLSPEAEQGVRQQGRQQGRQLCRGGQWYWPWRSTSGQILSLPCGLVTATSPAGLIQEPHDMGVCCQHSRQHVSNTPSCCYI